MENVVFEMDLEIQSELCKEETIVERKLETKVGRRNF